MAHDVAIVGGGIIGLACAWELSKAGARAIVLECGETGREASWASAGIVMPGRLATARSGMQKLQGLGAEGWPVLAEELQEATGLALEYQRCGALSLALDAESEHDLRSKQGRKRAMGLVCDTVGEQEVCRIEPSLDVTFRMACHLPEVACVRNPRVLKALAAGCERRGVEIRRQSGVVDLVRDGQRILGVKVAGGDSVAAGAVLVAAGAWSGQVVAALGMTLPVRPIRGQIALLRLPAPILRGFVEFGKKYLVPRADGRVLVGSTREDAGFVKETTPEVIGGLLDFARSVCPALKHAEVEGTWSGLRPDTLDHKPFIGCAPGFENLWVATGHYRSGIVWAPGTAQVMTDLLMGVAPRIPVEDFRLDRPMRRKAEEP